MKKGGGVFLLLSLLFGLSACATGKTLFLSLRGEPKNLDPAVGYDRSSYILITLVHETLFQYHYLKRPVELQPLLAESMPVVSKDKKTYTIKIKKGVMWQDDAAFPNGNGRELKAGDFIFAWKRMLLPELQSPGTWIFDGKVMGWEAFRKKLVEAAPDQREALLQLPIDGFYALDEYTIQIKLTRPYGTILNFLAMPFTAPVPKEATDKYGETGLRLRMIGTGPFRLAKYEPGSKVVLEKNPNFYRQVYPPEGDSMARSLKLLDDAGKRIPFIDRIEFVSLSNRESWQAFLRGKIDFAGIPPGEIKRVENGPEFQAAGVRLHKAFDGSLWFLGFNGKDKLLSKQSLIRRALFLAVDRESFVREAWGGRGAVAEEIVPPTIAGHTGLTLAPEYDPAGARRLLEKAGHPGGKGLPAVRLSFLKEGAQAEAAYLAKAFAAIGVRTKLEALSYHDFGAQKKAGTLQLFLDRLDPDYPDAINFLSLLYSKSVENSISYKSSYYDRLFEKTLPFSPLSSERNELIRRAQEAAFKEGALLPLGFPYTYSARHRWVKNYRPEAQIIGETKYFDLSPGARNFPTLREREREGENQGEGADLSDTDYRL